MSLVMNKAMSRHISIIQILNIVNQTDAEYKNSNTWHMFKASVNPSTLYEKIDTSFKAIRSNKIPLAHPLELLINKITENGHHKITNYKVILAHKLYDALGLGNLSLEQFADDANWFTVRDVVAGRLKELKQENALSQDAGSLFINYDDLQFLSMAVPEQHVGFFAGLFMLEPYNGKTADDHCATVLRDLANMSLPTRETDDITTEIMQSIRKMALAYSNESECGNENTLKFAPFSSEVMTYWNQNKATFQKLSEEYGKSEQLSTTNPLIRCC